MSGRESSPSSAVARTVWRDRPRTSPPVPRVGISVRECRRRRPWHLHCPCCRLPTWGFTPGAAVVEFALAAIMNGVIQLEGIHKTYHTGEVDVQAVRGVSIGICQGEFVALMGASGSGKSTMMNIIGCLDRPTLGRYHLDKIDVSQ